MYSRNEKLKLILKVTLFQLKSNLKSKWSLLYSLFFFVITFFSVLFTGDLSKVTLNLMNAIIFIIPLSSLLYGSIFFYNNLDYIIFILSYPLKRSTVYLSLFAGLSFSMIFGFLIGILLPLLFLKIDFSTANLGLLSLVISGIFLHLIFISIAILISVKNDNRLKGFSFSIFSWLSFSILYDGLFLFLLNYFSDYPLEYPSIVLSILNPIDLARIFITIQLDVAALMGYTGAIFHSFFSNLAGLIIILLSLLTWFISTLVLGIKFFNQKDF